MEYKFLCVDYQNEFVSPSGKWYNGGKSIEFINKILVPFLTEKNIKVSEIISDYRPPRLPGSGIGCLPGEDGFRSALPEKVKNNDIWVKAMNSPLWIRKNGGNKDKKAGRPYQAPKKFDRWLKWQFGLPREELCIILFGLTLDCCILCTAQELRWRGYNFKILIEGSDVMPNKDMDEVKKQIVDGQVLNHWLKFVSFEELEKSL